MKVINASQRHFCSNQSPTALQLQHLSWSGEEERKKLHTSIRFQSTQTWNLSKTLHHPIFRLKILHRQFHLILTVLVRKKHKKISENGEIYTTGKNFTLPPALTALTNSTSESTEHLNLIFLISNKLQFSFSLCRPHKSPVLCIFV